VNLGDVDIASVSNDTAGMKQVVSYRTPSNLADIENDWYKFQNGFAINGYTYSSRLPMEIGAVYGLRSIASRGVSPQETNGYTFNEFDHDNRRDYVVVFKVLKKSSDASVTIIWRLLQDQKSPESK
jgi:hypothetical protein